MQETWYQKSEVQCIRNLKWFWNRALQHSLSANLLVSTCLNVADTYLVDTYGVATISRLLKIIGFFCRI